MNTCFEKCPIINNRERHPLNDVGGYSYLRSGLIPTEINPSVSADKENCTMAEGCSGPVIVNTRVALKGLIRRREVLVHEYQCGANK